MGISFYCFLTLKYVEYCVSYSLGHSEIGFLDQKNPLLGFLNFSKFEHSFLYTVSYIPILSVVPCQRSWYRPACAPCLCKWYMSHSNTFKHEITQPNMKLMINDLNDQAQGFKHQCFLYYMTLK